jgi:hypothetical protein
MDRQTQSAMRPRSRATHVGQTGHQPYLLAGIFHVRHGIKRLFQLTIEHLHETVGPRMVVDSTVWETVRGVREAASSSGGSVATNPTSPVLGPSREASS